MSNPDTTEYQFDDPEAEQAAFVLRAVGYDVADIPRAETSTCDLSAALDRELMVIEVKTLTPKDSDRTRIALGENFGIEHQLARSRNIDKLLKKASRQLSATETVRQDPLQLVWTRFRPPGDIGRSLECFCTLYGVRWFHITRGPTIGAINIIPVFFSDRSWFRKHPEVCAVVEDGPRGMALRVNPVAHDRAALEESRLFQVFRELRGVFDLLQFRESPQIYVADDTSLQPTMSEVTQSLFDNYGITVEGHKESASIAVWPGNEMGSYSDVPGWDIRIPQLDWLDFLTARPR